MGWTANDANSRYQRRPPTHMSHREIAPGIHWICEPGPDRTERFDLPVRQPSWWEPNHAVHIPQCAYLIAGERATLLFDTLSPATTDQVLATIDEIVGDRGLTYLVVSHPDVPHAGNTHAILEAYPDATLVAPGYGNDHELYHLDQALHVTAGDSIDLGGRIADFHEATFLDAPISIWMSERTSETLFPVDWMGFPHLDDEVMQCVEEVDRPVDVERLVEFHSRVLFWYQYVDVEKTNREIDRLIERFDPSIIAPAHGLVFRADAPTYMARMKDVTRAIEQQGRIGTLG